VIIPKRVKFVGILFLFIWSFWSFNETFKWTSNTQFARSNFERSPNCSSALLYSRLSFLEKEEIPLELKKFLISSGCLNAHPQDVARFSLNEFFTVIIYLIYYDSDRSIETKIMELEKFKNVHYLSYFFLASLKINQKKFQEANELIFQVIKSAEKNLSHSFEPVVAKVLLPYCQKNKSLSCEDFMIYFSTKPGSLFYE
jgi:hypothetical protein